MISARMLARVWIDLITMVSTVNYAASVNNALRESETSVFRVAIHAAKITVRCNHALFQTSVWIGTRIHVQGKKLK